jgi:hypothetical protein
MLGKSIYFWSPSTFHVIKKYQNHLLAIGVFVALSLAYFSPVLKGKVLTQHDVVQSQAMAKEIKDIYEEEGRVVRWTGRMFGGMPADQIWSVFPSNVYSYILNGVRTIFPRPVNLLFLYLLGMYILLIAIGCNSWLAALGSVAFAFSTYNFTIIEAGHLAKVKALAFTPAVFAGAYLAFRKKYFAGLLVMAIFLGLQIRSNHFQITYYTAMLMIIWGIFELVKAFREKTLPNFGKAVAVMVVAAILGVLPNLSLLWPTYEYSEGTIRGAQELSEKKIDGDGLDKDYALRWSYGLAESWQYLIPRFSGGASTEALDENSATYEALTDLGVPKRNAEQFVARMPTYWGPQPFTSGPAYFGSILILLAVFSMFLSRSTTKWWLVAGTIFCLLISMGKHMQWFYDIFWNTFPMFNKFRTPTMVMAMGNVTVIWLAALGLKEVIEKEMTWAQLKKPFFRSLAVVGGICLIFASIGPAFFDFNGANDSGFEQQLLQMTNNNQNFATTVLDGLIEDRASMMRSDAMRSLIFVLLGAWILLAFFMQKLKMNVAMGLLAGLLLIDLWAIDKIYLNNDDFVKDSNKEAPYRPKPADMEILKDQDPHFRVLNLNVSTFNDAFPSYHYKTIGGYHAAKLKRYQDLIERHISPEIGRLNNGFQATPVLNMLNTKYVVTSNDAQGVIKNPLALGTSWFVDEILWADNPDDEIAKLRDLNPSRTVVIDKRFESYFAGSNWKPARESALSFTSYKPDELVYQSTTTTEAFGVFSEVFYKGNKNWKAYIDGVEAEFIQVNYVLRGMLIPAGEHEIVFKYRPAAYYTGENISMAGSILLLLLTISYFFRDRIPFLAKKEAE